MYLDDDEPQTARRRNRIPELVNLEDPENLQINATLPTTLPPPLLALPPSPGPSIEFQDLTTSNARLDNHVELTLVPSKDHPRTRKQEIVEIVLD